MDDDFLPEIVTDFDLPEADPRQAFYHMAARQALKKIIPIHFWEMSSSSANIKDLKHSFLKSLPFFTWMEMGDSRNISFYLLSRHRPNAFKFFLDMMGNCLIPNRRLNIPFLYSVDFRFPSIGNEQYTMSEVMVHVESEKEYQTLLSNLPNAATEIRLGAKSSFYAKRILDIKGFSSDEKISNIQEHLNQLIHRFPNSFDEQMYTEMQHVMIICPDSFKNVRLYKHLSHIIVTQYIVRKNLFESIKATPQRRHLTLKIFKALIKQGNSFKKVLSLFVGLNFLSDNEIFEEKHLLKAIQNYLPHVKSVEDSFFVNHSRNEAVCTVYLEVERVDGEDFSIEEIQRLKRELPNDLKDRIEHLMHPIFMPRNEEEVMRNVLSLSAQLNYLKDVPQVFITFDEQAQSHLFFTIILVRILKGKDISIEECFQKSHSFLEYIADFTRTVGSLRKKHLKEATVFQVKISKNMFLRGDHSIDLCKARQIVVEELERILGKIRDYNGGMISKQNELLCHVRSSLAEHGNYNDLLLENFFYSLTPIIMRSILDPHTLKTLFLLMMENLEKKWFESEAYHLTMRRELDVVYVMITSRNPKIKDAMFSALSRLNIAVSDLGTVCVNAADTPCLGYIYRCDDPYKQEYFCQVLKHALEVGSLVPQETLT